ncbi:MAG: hypothetical protein D4Q79_01775 [Spirochaetia bacterium]|nr:MAG: hypothetical protein D4Q79_01775 [Spirochaetia bacterium]
MEEQIKNKILEAIKSGAIEMKPKWRFILTGVLFVVGVILILSTLLLLTSFIFFSVNRSGIGFGPAFGPRGIMVFLKYLPWTLIGFSIIFVIILEILVRHYSFGYRKPLLFSLVAIILVVITGGIAAAPLHKEPFKRANENNLPFAGPIYRGFGPIKPDPDDINKGEIIEMLENGFRIKNAEEELRVFLPEQILPQLENDFKLGDNVIIFGKRNFNEIQAFGVKKMPT